VGAANRWIYLIDGHFDRRIDGWIYIYTYVERERERVHV